jgi:hypothetical protein
LTHLPQEIVKIGAIGVIKRATEMALSSPAWKPLEFDRSKVNISMRPEDIAAKAKMEEFNRQHLLAVLKAQQHAKHPLQELVAREGNQFSDAVIRARYSKKKGKLLSYLCLLSSYILCLLRLNKTSRETWQKGRSG